MIKLKAPDGYQYHDTRTDRNYSEIVIDAKERDRFTLVPAQTEPTINI